MRLLRLLRHLLAIASFGFVAATAGAAPADPKNGVDYLTLNQAQQTDSGKKIEVIEFFGYFCPHCNALDPLLTAWVKKQGDNISLKRVHVDFHELYAQQKLYFTLEAMGKLDELHSKVFRTVHIERNPLATDEAVIAFISKQGIDVKRFLDIYNSFSIQTKLQRAKQLAATYKLDVVPTLAIDGRFVTSPSMVGRTLGPQNTEEMQNAAVLKVMDVMIARIEKEKHLTATSARK